MIIPLNRITNYELGITRRGNISSLVMFISCLSLLVIPRVSGFSQNKDFDEAVRAYIETYRTVAVKEMMEYRIPASITLAQGIYESNAGRSRLAIDANNHVGIKCHKEWEGNTFFQDDETQNECFRNYSNPEE